MESAFKSKMTHEEIIAKAQETLLKNVDTLVSKFILENPTVPATEIEIRYTADIIDIYLITVGLKSATYIPEWDEADKQLNTNS